VITPGRQAHKGDISELASWTFRGKRVVEEKKGKLHWGGRQKKYRSTSQGEGTLQVRRKTDWKSPPVKKMEERS